MRIFLFISVFVLLWTPDLAVETFGSSHAIQLSSKNGEQSKECSSTFVDPTPPLFNWEIYNKFTRQLNDSPKSVIVSTVNTPEKVFALVDFIIGTYTGTEDKKMFVNYTKTDLEKVSQRIDQVLKTTTPLTNEKKLNELLGIIYKAHRIEVLRSYRKSNGLADAVAAKLDLVPEIYVENYVLQKVVNEGLNKFFEDDLQLETGSATKLKKNLLGWIKQSGSFKSSFVGLCIYYGIPTDCAQIAAQQLFIEPISDSLLEFQISENGFQKGIETYCANNHCRIQTGAAFQTITKAFQRVMTYVTIVTIIGQFSFASYDLYSNYKAAEAFKQAQTRIESMNVGGPQSDLADQMIEQLHKKLIAKLGSLDKLSPEEKIQLTKTEQEIRENFGRKKNP